MKFTQVDLKGGSREQMISRETAEQIIEKHFDANRLKTIIIKTSVVAWKNIITDKQIEKWLQNFNGRYFANIENERRLALWLLAHFSFYTQNDVRVLCKNLFNQYLHEKLRDYKGKDLTYALNEILSNTLFVGLGNDSESGNNILYHFRQENQLAKGSFDLNLEKTYENLVYIDDVTISGSQALDYINSRNLKARNTYVAMLIATKRAINILEGLPENPNPIKTISCIILDERDQTFSTSAYVFSDKRIAKIKPIAQEFCKIYGQIAVTGWDYMESHPLGYKNGQYMIGFDYNTPDNTLPIFWGTGKDWNPLFTRYPKIYGGKEYQLDARKYY